MTLSQKEMQLKYGAKACRICGDKEHPSIKEYQKETFLCLPCYEVKGDKKQ